VGAARIVVAVAINALALWVADRLFAGVRLVGWESYVIGAAALGFANTVLRPLLTILTLPLVIVSLGLFYLLINVAMVAFAAWVAPNFTVHGFWDYLGTVVIVWLVNWSMRSLLDDVQKRPRLARR
jgi:putative membrane protein